MDFSTTSSYDVLTEKWEPLLSHDALPVIGDSYKRKVTAVLLENQEKALREQYLVEAPANSMNGGGFQVSQGAGVANSNLAGYDPILISLVRRSMPNLIAYDIAGVQPMTAPTGLIFAMRSKYNAQGGPEALYAETYSKFGGSGNTHFGAAFSATGGINPIGSSGTTFNADAFTSTMGIRDANYSMDAFRGFLTGTAEALGEVGGVQFKEMAFSIERIAVEAKTRALKAEYTTELAQDLKAVHGLDAESELANILSTEILNEINRELVHTIYRVAKTGASQSDLSVPGVYDLNTDSDGRWSAERFRGLMFQIERECNVIAKETRRGKGNFMICSSDVASALTMGGFMNLAPAVTANLDVDDTGNTFVGVLNNKIKVYIDPYAKLGVNYCVVGYRGSSPYDAGIFYCPYVPLQMVRAVDQNTFQPKIGFKTRYGMVANPFAESTNINALGSNQYYRIFQVTNLHGNTGFGL
jgi:Major capsid protein Gp23